MNKNNKIGIFIVKSRASAIMLQLPYVDRSDLVVTKKTDDGSQIKVSVWLYMIWTQQRSNSNMSYRSRNLNTSIYQNYLKIFKTIHRVRIACK